MSETIQSREYKPNPEKCCEACVFRTGKHAGWCELGERQRAEAAAWQRLEDECASGFQASGGFRFLDHSET